MIFLAILLLLQSNIKAQSFYSLPIKDIDGAAINLTALKGKNILFIMAPVTTADSVMIYQLDTLQKKYNGQLAIIGIMSREDGFTDGAKVAIKALYQGKNIPITLTEGMYTRKSAGSNQSALMQWLTKKENNNRFDIEPRSTGHKFYVGKTGMLNGVQPTETSLLGANSYRLINIQ